MKKSKGTLRKGSPYSFETFLNGLDHTVVYIKKGKKKAWLFNILSDGSLGFDVYHDKSLLESMGINFEEDGEIKQHGFYTLNKVMSRLDEIQKFFERAGIRYGED